MYNKNYYKQCTVNLVCNIALIRMMSYIENENKLENIIDLQFI